MKNISNILFISNNSDDDAAALAEAVNLAKANQAKITVVGFIQDTFEYAFAAGDLIEQITQQRQDQLNALISSVSADSVIEETAVLSGRPFIRAIKDVLNNNRDLLIKPGAQKDVLNDYLFGSTDMKLLRKCPCPVWLIKTPENHAERKILVALDYDPENHENERLNTHILETAATLALAGFGELHIVHSWRLANESFLRSARVPMTDPEVDGMVDVEKQQRQEWLSNLVTECLAKHGKEAEKFLKPQLHLVQGNTSAEVPKLASELNAELLVMGTVARTGIPGFIMGNTAETILNRLDCSVLAIKPEGFVSPVQSD